MVLGRSLHRRPDRCGEPAKLVVIREAGNHQELVPADAIGGPRGGGDLEAMGAISTRTASLAANPWSSFTRLKPRRSTRRKTASGGIAASQVGRCRPEQPRRRVQLVGSHCFSLHQSCLTHKTLALLGQPVNVADRVRDLTDGWIAEVGMIT